MKYTFPLLMFFTIHAFSQTGQDVLNDFQPQKSNAVNLYDAYGEYPPPWYRWNKDALVYIYLTLAITSQQEYNHVKSDFWMLSEALYDMWMEKPLNTTELFKRDIQVQYSRPGQVFPMYLHYDLKDTKDVVDVTVENPYDGWYREIKSDGGLYFGDLAMASKVVNENLILLSVALPMKRHYREN